MLSKLRLEQQHAIAHNVLRKFLMSNSIFQEQLATSLVVAYFEQDTKAAHLTNRLTITIIA